MSRVLAGDLGWGGWKDQTADTRHPPQDSGEGAEAGCQKRRNQESFYHKRFGNLIN